MATKTPQDRQPKGDRGTPFTVAGKTYYIPQPSEDATLSVPGRVTRAVVMNPDDQQAQLALAFHMLDTVKLTPAARVALDSLSTRDMLEVVGRWLGESSGSSVSSVTTEEPSNTTGEAASA